MQPAEWHKNSSLPAAQWHENRTCAFHGHPAAPVFASAGADPSNRRQNHTYTLLTWLFCCWYQQCTRSGRHIVITWLPTQGIAVPTIPHNEMISAEDTEDCCQPRSWPNAEMTPQTNKLPTQGTGTTATGWHDNCCTGPWSLTAVEWHGSGGKWPDSIKDRRQTCLLAHTTDTAAFTPSPDAELKNGTITVTDEWPIFGCNYLTCTPCYHCGEERMDTCTLLPYTMLATKQELLGGRKPGWHIHTRCTSHKHIGTWSLTAVEWHGSGCKGTGSITAVNRRQTCLLSHNTDTAAFTPGPDAEQKNKYLTCTPCYYCGEERMDTCTLLPYTMLATKQELLGRSEPGWHIHTCCTSHKQTNTPANSSNHNTEGHSHTYTSITCTFYCYCHQTSTGPGGHMTGMLPAHYSELPA